MVFTQNKYFKVFICLVLCVCILSFSMFGEVDEAHAFVLTSSMLAYGISILAGCGIVFGTMNIAKSASSSYLSSITDTVADEITTAFTNSSAIGSNVLTSVKDWWQSLGGSSSSNIIYVPSTDLVFESAPQYYTFNPISKAELQSIHIANGSVNNFTRSIPLVNGLYFYYWFDGSIIYYYISTLGSSSRYSRLDEDYLYPYINFYNGVSTLNYFTSYNSTYGSQVVDYSNLTDIYRYSDNTVFPSAYPLVLGGSVPVILGGEQSCSTTYDYEYIPLTSDSLTSSDDIFYIPTGLIVDGSLAESLPSSLSAEGVRTNPNGGNNDDDDDSSGTTIIGLLQNILSALGGFVDSILSSLPTILALISGYTLFQNLFTHFLPTQVATILWAFWLTTMAIWLFRMIADR